MVLDALLPPLCVACHEPIARHHALCPSCWSRIDFIRPPLCDLLGLPMPFDTGGTMISAAAAARPPRYDRARAVARFAGPMRELVHDLKFRDRHDARALFGRWLKEAGRELLAGAEVTVPVPLARTRLLARRYNQAAILARELAHVSGLDYAPLALVRTRHTAPQVGLSRSERRRNVAGAFSVPERERPSIRGRNVLLVDDVITTGATANAAAGALKRAGARRVDVLALAMVADVAMIPD
jgi:ComF family protein